MVRLKLTALALCLIAATNVNAWDATVTNDTDYFAKEVGLGRVAGETRKIWGIPAGESRTVTMGGYLMDSLWAVMEVPTNVAPLSAAERISLTPEELQKRLDEIKNAPKRSVGVDEKNMYKSSGGQRAYTQFHIIGNPQSGFKTARIVQ